MFIFHTLQELNLINCETEICRAEKWSPKAISQCQYFINDENMAQIQLDIKENRGKCYFGNVTVQTLPKRSSTLATTDFANSLKVVNEAVEVDFEFSEGNRIFLFTKILTFKINGHCIKT